MSTLRVMLPLFLLLGLAVVATASDTDLPAETQAHLDSLPDDLTRVEYLQAQVEKAPGDVVLRYHLGNMAFDAQQYDLAIASLEKAVELQPDFVAGLVNLGSAYDEVGQLDKALGAYQKALALDPTEEKTLCNIGGIYFQKRQMEQAMNSFLAAIEANPQSQLAHYNLAILFADSGIYREAIAEWEKVVAIDPNSDLGARSADNIGIIKQMQETRMPDLEDPAGDGHSSHEGHSHDH